MGFPWETQDNRWFDVSQEPLAPHPNFRNSLLRSSPDHAAEKPHFQLSEVDKQVPVCIPGEGSKKPRAGLPTGTTECAVRQVHELPDRSAGRDFRHTWKREIDFYEQSRYKVVLNLFSTSPLQNALPWSVVCSVWGWTRHLTHLR